MESKFTKYRKELDEIDKSIEELIEESNQMIEENNRFLTILQYCVISLGVFAFCAIIYDLTK